MGANIYTAGLAVAFKHSQALQFTSNCSHLLRELSTKWVKVAEAVGVASV